MKQNNTLSTKYIASIGMFAALSFAAVLISRIIPNVAGFLSYEPKDAFIVTAGFIFGPMACLILSVLVSLIEMLSISTTGLYGFLMNVISTCAFAVPAAWIYQKHRTQSGAVTGLVIGVLLMAICMVLWNYIITPFYMGIPRDAVAAMLPTVFLPFNLVKGGINAGLTLLLYKPIVSALRKAKLAAPAAQNQKGHFSLGFTLTSLLVLLTFVLLLLVMLGIL